jgi:hypothetical protein
VIRYTVVVMACHDAYKLLGEYIPGINAHAFTLFGWSISWLYITVMVFGYLALQGTR